MNNKTVGMVLNELEQRGELLQDWRAIISAEADRIKQAGPWHTRLLIGFGAWLSSLLFIGFCATLGLNVGGMGIYAVVLLGASVAISKLKYGTFWDQAGLAASLSGQGFAIFAIMNSNSNDKSVGLYVVIFNLVWPFLVRTKTQAFLSMIFLTMGILHICYVSDGASLIPVVPAALLFAAISIVAIEPKVFKDARTEMLPSMAHGLLFGGFGVVSISNYFLLDTGTTIASKIYPNPWLTSALVMMLILYFTIISRDVLFKTRGLFAYAALIVIGIASFKAPGILFALGVAIAGVIFLEIAWLWLGLLFASVFTILFLYGGELSLLSKSYVLLGLGALLFAIRKTLPKGATVKK